MNELEKARYDEAMSEIPTFDESLIKPINCSNCNRRLLDIIRNEQIVSAKRTLMKVKCPFCNDSSFQHTIDGEFWIGDLDNVAHTDIDFEDIELDSAGKIKNCTVTVQTRKV